MSPTPPRRRRLVLIVGGLALLLALMVFIVKVGMPNIVSGGNAANHGVAVSMLRTILWAEDQYVKRTGRAGTLVELAEPVTLPSGERMDSPLLRPDLRPGPDGLTVYGGYAYRVHPRGKDFVGYAWPVLPGKSGRKVLCLNAHEDIFEAPSDARTPPYEGAGNEPAENACLPSGAGVEARLAEGVGGDGVVWTRWKGRETRRGKDPDR